MGLTPRRAAGQPAPGEPHPGLRHLLAGPGWPHCGPGCGRPPKVAPRLSAWVLVKVESGRRLFAREHPPPHTPPPIAALTAPARPHPTESGGRSDRVQGQGRRNDQRTRCADGRPTHSRGALPRSIAREHPPPHTAPPIAALTAPAACPFHRERMRGTCRLGDVSERDTSRLYYDYMNLAQMRAWRAEKDQTNIEVCFVK